MNTAKLHREFQERTDKCVCGHAPSQHAGTKTRDTDGWNYPGACTECNDIKKCGQFRTPINAKG